MDNEVGYAQAFGKRIFPVLVAGDNTSAVPISLIRVQWIDGRNDVGQTAMQELRLVLLRNLGRQSMDVATRIEFDSVTIPAGEFLMGSNKKKGILVDDSERPQHKLYLPAYRIACTPVTNAQYKRFIQATNYEPPEHWEKGSIPHGKKDHPVVYVSWQDAQAFCRWAGVRLPTEAEWEKAARGTDGRIYPWGNQKPDNALCNCAFKASDTTPVGAYPKGASPFGVLDMAGNVWEWTSSKIADYPYKADDGRQTRWNRCTRAARWWVR